jgi:RNA polymerase sigma factor (sigma-70 family)
MALTQQERDALVKKFEGFVFKRIRRFRGPIRHRGHLKDLLQVGLMAILRTIDQYQRRPTDRPLSYHVRWEVISAMSDYCTQFRRDSDRVKCETDISRHDGGGRSRKAGSALLDLATDDTSPAEDAYVTEARDRLRSLLERHLSPRERLVVEARFGIGRPKPATLAEIGALLGTSHQWVNQVEQKAMGKLRAAMDDP